MVLIPSIIILFGNESKEFYALSIIIELRSRFCSPVSFTISGGRSNGGRFLVSSGLLCFGVSCHQ
jgi:hypothetical protein